MDSKSIKKELKRFYYMYYLDKSSYSLLKEVGIDNDYLSFLYNLKSYLIEKKQNIFLELVQKIIDYSLINGYNEFEKYGHMLLGITDTLVNKEVEFEEHVFGFRDFLKAKNKFSNVHKIMEQDVSNEEQTLILFQIGTYAALYKKENKDFPLNRFLKDFIKVIQLNFVTEKTAKQQLKKVLKYKRRFEDWK